MSQGIPAAAEFIIYVNPDIEVARCVGGRNIGDGGVVDFLVDFQTAVYAVAEIGDIVSFGDPGNRVDADLIGATTAHADTADVHRPVEHPAIVDRPFVTNFYLPVTIQGTSDKFAKVGGGRIVFILVEVVA